MLTKLTIRNFKMFGEDPVEIELGNPVVFVGPNNSGKTTALQAIALWHLGVSHWLSERKPGHKKAVTINRMEIVSIPVPGAKLLWRDLHVRDMKRIREGEKSKLKTKNIRFEIKIKGINAEKEWECGMEFDYANEEAIYCRPIGALSEKNIAPDIPWEARDIRVAFLPPMSGLTAQEVKLEDGAVNVRIGEGRTAEVLRNLCFKVSQDGEKWKRFTDHVERLFGAKLEKPKYLAERGEITMGYEEKGVRLDLSSSGRGFQQTLLVLSYLYANPGAILLIDEPDAHLEFLRQRQIYQVLTEISRETGSQVIISSHSEVLLNEAADRDMVVAFLHGLRIHRIDDKGSQALKALKSIGFENYLLAEQTGWVLYLEGSTDLAILKAFADTLKHPAAEHLERPFVHYVGNQPSRATEHFFGIREAKPEFLGIAIFDRLETKPEDFGSRESHGLKELMWDRREIENYLCYPEVLLAYARGEERDLFTSGTEKTMRDVIEDIVPRVAMRDRNDKWWEDTKASDDFLDRVFEEYFKRLKSPNLLRKTDYHQLARLVPRDMIHEDVIRKLDAIVEIAERALREVQERTGS